MRQEDKEVDGPELEHAEERKRESELVEEDEQELHDLDGKPYELDRARDSERAGSIAAAMRKILEGQHIVINDLKLTARELKALEALQTAKRGRDGQLDRFVYAEDRRALLEQALAVLQPDMVVLEQLGKPFEELMSEVAELRGELNTLEDAEEEIIHKPKDTTKTEGDTDDKPADDDASLDGPERKIAKPDSSLAKGPEVKLETPESTLGKGPELKDEKRESTLSKGAEAKEEKRESSLGGGELKETAKPATSLGDPAEIEDTAKKRPWWKRAFGG